MDKADLNLIRYTLTIIWLVTGVLSLGVYPTQNSLSLLASVGLHGSLGKAALYGSAGLDIVLGILTLLRPACWLWRVQFLLILGYSVIIANYLPQFYLHPFGPILKNLPILLLLWFLLKNEGRKK